MERPAGFGQQYASAFQEPSVADAYAFRPPYPPAVFNVLTRLLPTTPQLLTRRWAAIDGPQPPTEY